MIIKTASMLLLITACYIISGCASSSAQLSASTMMLMNKYKNSKQKDSISPTLPQQVVDDYALQRIDNKYFANALINVNKNLNEKKLMEIGAKVNTMSGSIWSITIPLDAVEKLSLTEGVESIEIGIKTNNK